MAGPACPGDAAAAHAGAPDGFLKKGFHDHLWGSAFSSLLGCCAGIVHHTGARTVGQQLLQSTAVAALHFVIRAALASLPFLWPKMTLWWIADRGIKPLLAGSSGCSSAAVGRLAAETVVEAPVKPVNLEFATTSLSCTNTGFTKNGRHTELQQQWLNGPVGCTRRATEWV